MNGPIRKPAPQATAYIPIAEARSCADEISETNASDIGQNSESPIPKITWTASIPSIVPVAASSNVAEPAAKILRAYPKSL